MSSFRPVAALLALAMLPAIASGPPTMSAALRAELQALKNDYGARVDALEARIQQLEAAPAPSPCGRRLRRQHRSPRPRHRAVGASAFNPAISLILGGSYTSTSRDPGDWNIAGFPPSGGEVGPGERSFNLGESELTFAASIDPYFSGQLTAAITGDDEIEVEEAFVRTTALPDGFTAKLGRFFSGFGYLNEVHAHAWDFVDQPLVYQALFGGQFAAERRAGEVARAHRSVPRVRRGGGQRRQLPGDAPGAQRLERRDAVRACRRRRRRLHELARRAVRGSTAKAEDREGGIADASGEPLFDAFTGDARHLGRRWRAQVGAVTAAPAQGAGRIPASRRERRHRRCRRASLLADDYRNTQSGWYLQSVYQFAPRWRVGARYDSLDSGTPHYTLAPDGLLSARVPIACRVMLDWNPSEFSRLRAQYDWDNARDDGERDRILRLQYIYGIGAHGAHKY